MTIESTLERIAVALETLATETKARNNALDKIVAAVPRDPPRSAADGAIAEPAPQPARSRGRKPAETPPAAAAATPAPAAEPAKITVKEVADAVMDVANNVNRETAVGILQTLGVARVGELKPEKFAEALRLCAEAKAKSPPAAAPAAPASLI